MLYMKISTQNSMFTAPRDRQTEAVNVDSQPPNFDDALGWLAEAQYK